MPFICLDLKKFLQDKDKVLILEAVFKLHNAKRGGGGLPLEGIDVTERSLMDVRLR